MRRRQNKAEYDDIVIGAADLAVDLVYAEDILAAVTASLAGGKNPD